MNNIDVILKYTKELTLLYVEDNEEARESTLILFEYLFNDVIVSIDGRDGLNKFIQYHNNLIDMKIDMIITDLNMPNMSGEDMIKEIRKINGLVPIIILSAHDEAEYILESMKRGVSSYLNKPIDIDELLNSINKALNCNKYEIK